MKRTAPPQHAWKKPSLGKELSRTGAYFSVNKKMVMAWGWMKAGWLGNLTEKEKYFEERNQLQRDGSFFLTHQDQMIHNGMSEHEIRICKKFFKGLGIIQTRMKGIPPKEFYWINTEKLEEELLRIIPLKYRGISLKNIEDSPSKILMNNKDNKYKEHKEKEDISPAKNTPSISMEDSSIEVPSIAPHFKTYLIAAKKLRRAVRSKKKINIPDNQCTQWSKDIKGLIEKDLKEESTESAIKRVQEALQFYEKNIGGKYIPVIESGAALRQKFTKLEDAMRREASNGKGNRSVFKDPLKTREGNSNLKLSDSHPRKSVISVVSNW